VASTFSLPRSLAVIDSPVEIAPSLAGHRLGGSKTNLRPQQTAPLEDSPRNDYGFLSSSPPMKISLRAVTVPAQAPRLIANPPIMKLVRPALTRHETSMDKLQNGPGSRKTLGAKSSINGWGNRKTQAFKPPTMARRY
jgi:hypothetical protein